MNQTTTTAGQSTSFSTNYYSVDMTKLNLKEDASFLLQVLNSNVGDDTRDLADSLLYATLVDIFEVECECEYDGEQEDNDDFKTAKEDTTTIKVTNLMELLEALTGKKIDM